MAITGMMDNKAKKLRDYMSKLSEKAYYAGWMGGLEYDLWDIVKQNQPKEYGRLLVSKEHIETLNQLSKECGGWIVFDDEEMFVPMETWEKRYQAILIQSKT